MCPLFVALELSRTIKKIETAEAHFKKCARFDFSETLSDLKFKKIESFEKLIGKEWFIDERRTHRRTSECL